MKKRLSFICFVVWICIISITVSGCRSRNQNQANDSVVTESASDELTQFREKFTIENILNLCDYPDKISAAEKCGFVYISKDSIEDIDWGYAYTYIYGYGVDKTQKEEGKYELTANSDNACYFEHTDVGDIRAILHLKSKEDVDYLINQAQKRGFVKKGENYVGKKWGFHKPTESNGWYEVSFAGAESFPDNSSEEYEEATDNSNPNNGMSESNDIRVKEYQEKTMRCVGKIQDIMRQINSIYNSYVSASIRIDDIRKQSLGVNAIADISDLIIKGDDIFKEMIRLANEYGQQGNISTLRAEQEDFKKQGYQMSTNIRRDIYNENY